MTLQEKIDELILLHENTVLIADMITGKATRLKAAKKTREQSKQAFISLFLELVEGAKPASVQINMLRQWLNEERIKDAKLFVTNEMIERWLTPTPTTKYN